MSAPETGKLLDGVEIKDQEKDHMAGAEEGGKPSRIHRVTWVDLASIGMVLIGTIAAAVTIFVKPAAMHLGQKYQLVVLGFLLSIMASCSARQIQKLSLVYEARSGRSTLQNFDALLRSDYFSTTASIGPRSILLFVFCLPLGLSVAYKEFVGGSTSRRIPSSNTRFGFTAAPGYQLIGNGQSLVVNAYLPFWSQQALDRTYGFNVYVLDNQTAAILDAPLPENLTSLQAMLGDNEFMLLTAQVHATVTQSMDPSALERNDSDYWQAKRKLFPDYSQSNNTFYSVTREMWIGADPQGSNYTETFLSVFNVTLNQTFDSEAQRFVSTRRTCTGTWNITSASVTLTQVEDLQSIDVLQGTDQNIIANVSLNINDMFLPLLGEYDWATRVNWYQPFATTGQYFPAVNTRPSLVASMLWARITSSHGPERPHDALDSTSYWIDSDNIITTKSVVTLRRSSWLIFIMVIQPVLTILAVLGKAVLYTTPIGDNFGIISLLAGATGSMSKSLRGAALSGRLTRDVQITFTARKNSVSWYDRLELDVGSRERSSKLRPRTLYG